MGKYVEFSKQTGWIRYYREYQTHTEFQKYLIKKQSLINSKSKKTNNNNVEKK